jgi:DNA-binding transcriptional MerR regulator
VGRGNHYSPAHLDRLLKVKALQESGRTLDEIRETLHQRSRRAEQPDLASALDRAIWRRITLAPGVELNVSADVRLPSPGRLSELAAWCRLHFSAPRGDDHDA